MAPKAKGLILRAVTGLGLKGGAAVMQVVMFAAIARAMSASDFGELSFAFSLALIVSNIGSMGQHMLSLKEASVLSERFDENKEELSNLLRSTLLVVSAGTLVSSLIIVGLGLTSKTELLGELGVATAVLALAFSISTLLTHYFRSHKGLTFSFLPRDIIWRLCVTVCFVAIPYFGGAIGVAQSVLLASGILLFLTVLQVLSDKSSRQAVKRGWLTAKPVKKLKDAKYLWATSLLPMIGGPELATVILGLLLSPSEAGMFFAAFRLSLVMELFSRVAYIMIGPKIARLGAGQEQAKLQKVLSQSVLLVSLAGLIVFGIVALWGDKLLSFMNPEFVAAHLTLIVLSLGFLLSIMAGPGPAIMQLTGHEKQLMYIMIAINVVYLVGLAASLALGGILGAAIAISARRVILHVILARIVTRNLGASPTLLHPLLKKSKALK